MLALRYGLSAAARWDISSGGGGDQPTDPYPPGMDERIHHIFNPEGGESDMTVQIYYIQPAAALIAGILILIMPRLLNL
jgi:hypothetical protein